jgi:transcriptional regulator with XRE-family HTH domain
MLSIVNRISPANLLGFFIKEAHLTIEEAFGQIIKSFRKATNLSQEQLSEISSLDRSFISLLKNGKKQPSLITIFQLAKAFDTTPSKILADVEQKLQCFK